jgi:hypothetical protein
MLELRGRVYARATIRWDPQPVATLGHPMLRRSLSTLVLLALTPSSAACAFGVPRPVGVPPTGFVSRGPDVFAPIPAPAPAPPPSDVGSVLARAMGTRSGRPRDNGPRDLTLRDPARERDATSPGMRAREISLLGAAMASAGALGSAGALLGGGKWWALSPILRGGGGGVQLAYRF